MRIPIAGSWAVAWVLYGLNPAQFPTPDVRTAILLLAACAGSLMVVPASAAVTLPIAAPAARSVWVPRPYLVALVSVAFPVLAWDLWHLVPRALDFGLSTALVLHRTDRRLQTGAYSVPGFEVAHAAAMAAGVLGYGLWLRQRDRVGLASFLLGFACTMTSTGRWDVVTYAVWSFMVDLLVRPRSSVGSLGIGYVRLLVLVGVFFLAHGELLKKVDNLERLAAMSADERLLDDPALIGLAEAAGRPYWRGVKRACPRWETGGEISNEALQHLSRATRVFVVYFAGPLAAFDRVMCEGRLAARHVIFYWPHKLARLVGIRAGGRGPSVDPFVDVGIPTNNFTVMLSFVSELGGLAAGAVAWLVFAFLARAFVRWSLEGPMGFPGVVTATAVAVATVPTPLTNFFFDGTLVVWIGTAFGAWLCGRYAMLAARAPAGQLVC